MTVYSQRQAALMKQIALDAFLVINLEDSDPATLQYLTGFTGEGALVVSAAETFLLTDSRYTEQAARQAPRLAVRPVTASYLEAVSGALKQGGYKQVGFGSARLSHYWVERLRRRRVPRLVSLEDPVLRLRLIKSPDEVASIREAVAVTERALAEVLKALRIGDTERKIALDLEWRMRELGADKVAFEPIIAAGENSALPHYQPGLRAIKAGDLLLFDIGAQVRGYRSDMTRVVSVGKASARARELYSVVLKANRAGLDALVPGAGGKDVDAAARRVIVDAGHGDQFGHGLGHGVGLEVHEGPRLSAQSEDTMEPGMVVTVEPGIYLSGFGGVRIEDLVLVTKKGKETLTSFPSDRLVEVG